MKKILNFLIIVLTILMPLFHEIGHFFAYTINNIPAKFTYGFITSEKITFLGTLGAPLFNIIVPIVCLILIYVDKKRNLLWFITGITTIISRLFTCVFIIFLSIVLNPLILQQNDEGTLASFIGCPVIFSYIFFILIYTLLTLFLIKSIKNNKLVNEVILKVVFYNLIINIVLVFFL